MAIGLNRYMGEKKQEISHFLELKNDVENSSKGTSEPCTLVGVTFCSGESMCEPYSNDAPKNWVHALLHLLWKVFLIGHHHTEPFHA